MSYSVIPTMQLYKKKLYNISVDYIFHEAMKMRENLYQLEYCKPQYGILSSDFTEHEKKIIHEISNLIKKAEIRLKKGVKETKIFLNELVGQLMDLIILYLNNYLLPRFIIENEKSFYFRAGQSYIDSEYYELARKLFLKITRLDRKNRDAFFYINIHRLLFLLSEHVYQGSHVFRKVFSMREVKKNIKKIYRRFLQQLYKDLMNEIDKRKDIKRRKI